ncbi:hypothetical protein INR49_001015 [Caranx melampygus]|nr:hypothetical protein INR49_001015 [Caranx melampygus]
MQHASELSEGMMDGEKLSPALTKTERGEEIQTIHSIPLGMGWKTYRLFKRSRLSNRGRTSLRHYTWDKKCQ